MTVEQCGLFLEARNEMQIESFKDEAVLLNGLSTQIVSGVAGLFIKNHKMIALDGLYPNLFGNSSLRKEQSTQTQSQIWLNFLSV